MRLEQVLLNAESFDLVDRMAQSGNVTVLVGGRGSGKTAAAFWGAEEAHSREPARLYYACGLPPKAREVLPKWIILAKEVHDVANGSFVILEESALAFSARRSFTEQNLLLVDTIDIARHKQLSLVFISQSSALVDVNIMRLADTLAIKEPSLLQTEMERRQVKRIMENAATALAKVPAGQRKGKAFILDTKYNGVVDTGLPSFWSDNLSRLYESHSVRENAGGTSGTVESISYWCGDDTDYGLCPKDQGSRYIHKFSKNKPKMVMDEEKIYILGKVQVKESGINDYEGGANDYSQLEPPRDRRVLGDLVALQVEGEELFVKGGKLVTDPAGERLYVIDAPQR